MSKVQNNRSLVGDDLRYACHRNEVGTLIYHHYCQNKAIRSVEFHRIEMYWKLGERIFNEEQGGKDRADYGSFLIKNLAKEIKPEYGSGFSKRQLAYCRQLYRSYPKVNALRAQLNWFQYRLLISISDTDKREYYELEAVKNNWNGRELERQINSHLYEKKRGTGKLKIF